MIFVRIKLRAKKIDEARKIISPVGKQRTGFEIKKYYRRYTHICSRYEDKYVCVCGVLIPAPKGDRRERSEKNASMLCTKIVQFTFQYNFHYGQFAHRFPLTISEIYHKTKRIRRYLETKCV